MYYILLFNYMGDIYGLQIKILFNNSSTRSAKSSFKLSELSPFEKNIIKILLLKFLNHPPRYFTTFLCSVVFLFLFCFCFGYSECHSKKMWFQVLQRFFSVSILRLFIIEVWRWDTIPIGFDVRNYKFKKL